MQSNKIKVRRAICQCKIVLLNTTLTQLIQVVFTLTGLYVGSIIFTINILVITIELFYQYLTQLNKGEKSLFILKERIQRIGIPLMDIASSLFNFGTPIWRTELYLYRTNTL